MPDATWAVNRHPPAHPGRRSNPGFDVIFPAFDTSTAENYVHRSSSRPIPDAIEPRLFPRRSAQRSSANAPVGGLKPPPEGRLRRAIQPPSLLQHRSQRDHHLPIRPASCVRVHDCSMPVYPDAFPNLHQARLAAQRQHRREQLAERDAHAGDGTPRSSSDPAVRIAVITLYATSSQHARSIPRDGPVPARSTQYNSRATT